MSRLARAFALALTATAPGLVALLLPRPWLVHIGQWVEQHELVLLGGLPLLLLLMVARHIVTIPSWLYWPAYVLSCWGAFCWGGAFGRSIGQPESSTELLGGIAFVAAGLAIVMPWFWRQERDQASSAV
jgi:hypothetical protein